MGKSKKDHDEQRNEFWRRHIAGCLESGLNYAEYARRHELKGSTFTYWRKRLSRSSPDNPAFVELKVSDSKPNDIEITLRNQIRVCVGSDFDETVLKKLIGVLESA